MYVITKKIKDNYYLYLAENSRNTLSRTPVLKTKIYIGRAERFSKEELNEIKRLAKDNAIGIKEFIKDLQKDNLFKILHKKSKKNLSSKRCIICGFDAVVHFHHIIPVSKGGLSIEENIICLCPNHHEMIPKSLIKDKELRNYIKRNRDVRGKNNLSKG